MFCDFILVILTLMVNWMLLQDHYNLDICVMSSPSMVQVLYCWLGQTHEQSNRSVCNRCWRAAPEMGKTVRILASSICMRFKICQGMTLLMDEWFLMSEQTKCLHLQHSSSSITILLCNVRNHSPNDTASHPTIHESLQHHRENLTSDAALYYQQKYINDMPFHHITAHTQSADKWDGLHGRGHTG